MVHVCIAGRFGGHFGGLGQILDIRLVDLPFRQRVQHVLVQTRAIKTGGPSCSVHHAGERRLVDPRLRADQCGAGEREEPADVHPRHRPGAGCVAGNRVHVRRIVAVRRRGDIIVSESVGNDDDQVHPVRGDGLLQRFAGVVEVHQFAGIAQVGAHRRGDITPVGVAVDDGDARLGRFEHRGHGAGCGGQHRPADGHHQDAYEYEVDHQVDPVREQHAQRGFTGVHSVASSALRCQPRGIPRSSPAKWHKW